MPAVPMATVPSVAPAESSGVPYQTSAGASPEAFGAGIGAAEQGLGRQVEQTGDMLAKHVLRMQEDANVTSAEKLFLDQDIKLSNLTEQYNSLQGSARVNALPKFHEDASALREEGLNSASNSDVKKKFDQLFTRQLGFSIKAAGRESASAFRADQKATSAAIKENSFNNIAKNAQDDTQFLAATQNALTSQRSLPEYQGASDEVKLYMDRSLISGAWVTRLQSMMKPDPIRARELYKKNVESIDGDARLKLEPQINQQIIQRDTAVQSDKIINDLGSGTMEERLKKLEGYRETPYWDYKQTTSGYGTKAQLGDENIPPEQRKAIYTQRLRNELSSAYQIVDNAFPGLPKGARDALADLTFNVGSGWTQQGLGQAVRAGDMEKAKGLLGAYVNVTERDGMRHPLQALVDRRAAELSWWNDETGPAVASDIAGMQVQAIGKAKERAAQVFPDEPAYQAAYLDTLQSKIMADTRVMEKQARDLQLQTRNTVQAELFNPDHHVTSYDLLSSKAQAAYDSAPPALQQSFQAAMRKNATADVPLTAERQSRFDELRGESINQPDKFMSRDISNEDIPRPQKSILLKAQSDRKALVDKGTSLNSAMTSIQGLLNDAGIGKSASDLNKNAEYNKFSGVFTKALDDFSAEKKRPANDRERQEIGKNLLKEIVTGPGWTGYMLGGASDRAYRVIADKTPIRLREGDEAAHFATIPRGATFIGPDGQTRVKP